MSPFNTDSNFSQEATSLFGCKPGKFPFKYLGLPLYDRKLTVKDWDFLLNKLTNKLQSWSSQLLSIGGRLTLLNSSLSSVPLYALSLLRVPITVLDIIDKLRRQFQWQGYGSNKKKYVLINWPPICMTKSQGGMGILNLDHMNIAFLTKWLWKLKNPSYQGLWKNALILNYFIYHLPPLTYGTTLCPFSLS